ncbi:MAG: DUF2520 domain-containing protein [Chlorobi bacterium]|nr:DUF2520 domain-containing protein [Chlorobiota bacterium]
MKEIKKISFIGAGNVATHLAKTFVDAGKEITQVFSRDLHRSRELAIKCEAVPVNEISGIGQDADLIVISVSDDALVEVVDQLKVGNTLVVHTSGSVSMDVLKPLGENIGVFYPLQTFSKERDICFNEVPLCLEAGSMENLELLKILAISITEKIYFIDSAQREKLHLAAVFACNFPNFLYSIAENILEENGLSFEMMKPLIIETAEKAKSISPSNAQTGPALRKDIKIIDKHIGMLSEHEDFREVYELLSKKIMGLTSN